MTFSVLLFLGNPLRQLWLLAENWVTSDTIFHIYGEVFSPRDSSLRSNWVLGSCFPSTNSRSDLTETMHRVPNLTCWILPSLMRTQTDRTHRLSMIAASSTETPIRSTSPAHFPFGFHCLFFAGIVIRDFELVGIVIVGINCSFLFSDWSYSLE